MFLICDAGRLPGRPVFDGQKPADYGQNGRDVILAVCWGRSNNIHTDLTEDIFMRHFYFRFIFGIVWLAAAIVSAIGANIPFAVLYVALGVRFLGSAWSLWKKEKKGR